MKKLTASLGIAYMTLLSATAQTIDLFNWAGKDIIPKEQFITFYEKDTTGYTAIEKKYPLYKYQETDITSSNGKHQYKISTGSFSPQEEMGNAYEYFDISNNGKRIMREWGKALLWDVRLLTMDKNDRAHYIKVPHNFVLGWIYSYFCFLSQFFGLHCVPLLHLFRQCMRCGA